MFLKHPGVEPVFLEKAASFDRLKNIAYPIALLIAFGSPYHRRPNGIALLIRSKPRCPSLLAEFQAIGNDVERFNAFLSRVA
jgi:hypothetical protein